MRRSTALPLLAFLHGAFLLPIAPALAAPVSDSPPPIYLVVTTKGDSIQARTVEPQPFDMVRVTTPAYEYFFVPASHIRNVFDESGHDQLKEMLDHRRTVGWPLEEGARARAHPLRPSLYGPRSVTAGVGITEMSGWGRIGGPSSAKRSYSFIFDAGHLFNVGSKTALGATLFAGGGEGSAEVGFRLRFRYWIGQEASIDVSPGVILAHDEPGVSKGDGPGWVGQVAWNPSRFLSLGAQVYTVRRTSTTLPAWIPFQPNDVSERSYTVPGGRDTGYMIGMKLGGKPALLAAVAAAIIAMTQEDGKAVYAPTSGGLP